MRFTVADCEAKGLFGRMEVLVDGKPVQACFEADEEAGYARCWPTDDRGRIVADFDEHGKLRTVEHRGEVEIRIREAVAP